AVDEGRIDDALADGARDAQMEYGERKHVEEGSPQHGLPGFEYTGRNHGRDRICGIVEAVHEIERQRQQHQQDQRGGDGAQVHQEFSSTTLSMTFATSWHLSVADSS